MVNSFKLYGIITGTFLFASIFIHSSCEETTPAKAAITVLDTANFPVEGAVVELSQDSVVNPTTGVPAMINDVQITNASGQTFHEFQWEAVLNVEVTKGNITVTDFIRLEQSSTVNKLIILE